MGTDQKSRLASGGVFATTHWSVVLAAKEADGPRGEGALERLCRTYWPPLYAYIRREGYSPEDAQDLTQEFLSRFVHREWLNFLHDQRGKFRSFLLTFLKHFLSDQRDRDRAAKRGGGKSLVALESFALEERDHIEAVNPRTADQVYEKRWAQAIMEQAVGRLRREYAESGRALLFDELKDLQPGERGDCSYAEIGARLGLSEQAVKNAVHRLRRRHREILRDEIAQTVANPSELEEEIQYLLTVLAR